MNTKELPAHPSLERYKKQAKELLKSAKSGHREALQHTLRRIKKDHSRFARLADLELQGTKLALADAQLVIAREHGFECWPRFAKHIQGLTRQDSPVSRFESAVERWQAQDSHARTRIALACNFAFSRGHGTRRNCQRMDANKAIKEEAKAQDQGENASDPRRFVSDQIHSEVLARRRSEPSRC